MKILCVVDLMGWCIENRAKALKKYLPQYEIDILGLKDKAPFLKEHGDEYDLIHWNYSYNLQRYGTWLKNNGYRTILTHSNQRTLMSGEGGEQKAILEIMDELAAITTVAKGIADTFPKYNMTYIPNGIDEDIFSKRKNPIVGYAGSQNNVKNFDTLKQACEELGLELRTTGNTDRMGDKIKAEKSLEEMQDFYMGIDVYVHPSLSEGCNNTILEALSCNIPVLMTRTGIWRDLEGYVIFIEPTVESIKTELRKFMGRRLIEEKFLWKNLVPKYAEVYERVYANLPKERPAIRFHNEHKGSPLFVNGVQVEW